MKFAQKHPVLPFQLPFFHKKNFICKKKKIFRFLFAYMQKKQYLCSQIRLAEYGLMTIAVFGNAMKSQTLVEVRHIMEFMTEKGVHVLLSQELRQELDLREYPGFPENWDSDEQPENVYGEPIDFALSVGGDGTFLTSSAVIGDKNIPILGVNVGHLGFLADVQSQNLDDIHYY